MMNLRLHATSAHDQLRFCAKYCVGGESDLKPLRSLTCDGGNVAPTPSMFYTKFCSSGGAVPLCKPVYLPLARLSDILCPSPSRFAGRRTGDIVRGWRAWPSLSVKAARIWQQRNQSQPRGSNAISSWRWRQGRLCGGTVPAGVSCAGPGICVRGSHGALRRNRNRGHGLERGSVCLHVELPVRRFVPNHHGAQLHLVLRRPRSHPCHTSARAAAPAYMLCLITCGPGQLLSRIL